MIYALKTTICHSFVQLDKSTKTMPSLLLFFEKFSVFSLDFWDRFYYIANRRIFLSMNRVLCIVIHVDFPIVV